MSTFRTLNLDPAIGVTGWSITDYDIETGELVVNNYGVIEPSKLAGRANRRDDVKKFRNRTIALDILSEAVIGLCNTHHPHYMVIEDYYIDFRTPNASISLISIVSCLSVQVYQKLRIPTHVIPATIAKQHICGNGKGSKEMVSEAIIHHPNISFKKPRFFPESQNIMISEHEADSIALGYTFAISIYPTIIAT